MADAPKLEFTPEVFDPKKAELQAIAAEVAQITADPSKMTKEDFELINTTKNKLVKVRTRITSAGKTAREAANKYNSDVIAYEKELIAIVEPQEKRLKEIEAAAKAYAMRQEREKTLPEFKAKLDSIGDDLTISDEELLEFDPNQRTEYYNGRLSLKLEADKAAADAKRAEEDEARAAEQKKLDEERERIEADKRLAEEREYGIRASRLYGLGMGDFGAAEFKFGDNIVVSKEEVRAVEAGGFEALFVDLSTRIDVERQRLAAEAEAKHAEDVRLAAQKATEEAQAAEAKKQADEAAEKERQEAAERAAEAERTSAEQYQKWLADNSYNAETDYIQKGEGTDVLYRRVSIYNHQ